MAAPRPLAEGILESLRETAVALSRESGVSYPASPRILVLMLFASLLVLSGTGSLVILTAALASSIITLTLLARGASLRWSLGIICYAVLFAAIVSAPALIIGDPIDYAVFLLRVSAAVTLTIAVVSAAGWRSLLEGLGGLGVPLEFLRTLELTLFLVPVYAGEALRVAMARRARVLGGLRLRSEWRLLASVAAEVLARVMRRAEAYARSARARRLGSSPGLSGYTARGSGVLPYIPLAPVLVLWVLYLVGLP